MVTLQGLGLPVTSKDGAGMSDCTYYYYLILSYNSRPFSELQLVFKGPLLN